MGSMFPPYTLPSLWISGRGRMEYTYITSKDLPSEILQAPCMVCACILTLANLNSVVYYLRVKIL